MAAARARWWAEVARADVPRVAPCCCAQLDIVPRWTAAKRNCRRLCEYAEPLLSTMHPHPDAHIAHVRAVRVSAAAAAATNATGRRQAQIVSFVQGSRGKETIAGRIHCRLLPGAAARGVERNDNLARRFHEIVACSTADRTDCIVSAGGHGHRRASTTYCSGGGRASRGLHRHCRRAHGAD